MAYKKRSAMSWVSVKDRIPENMGVYLCCFNNGEYQSVFSASLNALADWTITRGEYYGDRYLGSINLGEVTHWMPLPKPPIQ